MTRTRWPELPLGELCRIEIGKTPPRARADFWGPGHRWLSIADMGQGIDITSTTETITDAALRESNCRLVRPGTVLLSFKLSIGKVGIPRLPLYTNEAIAQLPVLDHSRLYERYLLRALESLDLHHRTDRAAMGSTLNKAKLQRIRIPLPPVEEQRRIAAILDAADELRAKRRESLALLDSLTESIFLDMFGDPFADSSPWPIGRLGDVVSRFETGKSIETRDSDPETAVSWVLKVSAVTSGWFRGSEAKPVPPDYAPRPDHIVRRGDLLFSRANTEALVGASALVDEDAAGLLLSDKLWRFVWRPDAEIAPHYVWKYLQQPRTRRAIGALSTGTSGSMKNVSQAKIMTLPMPLPPLAEQREFEAHWRDIALVERSAIAGVEEFDALFASLQHRAFRGEL